MKNQDSPLSKVEMLLFVLALAAIGAALGLLIATDPQQGLVGFVLGGLVGIIVGALLALLLNLGRGSPGVGEKGEEIKPPTANSSPPPPYPSNTRLTITNAYSKETIPVQLALLVSYEATSAIPNASKVDKTPTSNSVQPNKMPSNSIAAEEVIRSLVTTAARRYVLTKTIDELETPEAFEPMGQRIVDEVNPSLTHWSLEVKVVNVEEIRLPDEVIAGLVTQSLRERNAETDRRIEAARVKAMHDEMRILRHAAETSFAEAKATGKGTKQQSRYVLQQLLIEMKNQAATEDGWPAALDELLTSLAGAPV